jgi:hypothetical protein
MGWPFACVLIVAIVCVTIIYLAQIGGKEKK